MGIVEDIIKIVRGKKKKKLLQTQETNIIINFNKLGKEKK